MDIMVILNSIEKRSFPSESIERIAGMSKKEKKVRIFSALEVADICGVVNQTAINWIKNGFLKAFTTPGGQYRVYAEDLMAFLTARGMRIPRELEEKAAEEPDWGKVLIVDDDESVNNLLKKFLAKRMAEMTVLQAFDGYEAGRMIAGWRPGVILLDINLPGLDGHKLCRKIKTDAALGNPVVIAITGLSGDDLQNTILEEGADAFFTKPINFDALRTKLVELIEAHRGGGNVE
jgi:two-component system OmpR family response regulator